MSAWDLGALFAQFALLSLLSVGGTLGTLPESHRFLVETHGWLTHQQFIDSVTIAQTSPGPNILYVTLLGWHAAGVAGAIASTAGIMLPSSLLTWVVNRWKNARSDSRLVRAIRLGLSPIAIGLTLAAGWVIARSNDVAWPLALLTALTVLVVVRTRLNPLWLIAAGAAAGAAGWI